MTTFRLRDRVYVTHDAGASTWTRSVVNAFPFGDRLVYAVRPEGAGPEHPGFLVEAGHVAPAGQERAR